MKKHLFLKSLLVLIGVLITSLTTQMWATDAYIYVDLTEAPGWYKDIPAVHYWNGSSDQYASLSNGVAIKTDVYRVTVTNATGWRVCRKDGNGRYNDLTWISGTTTNYFKVNSDGNGGNSATIPNSFYTNSDYIYYRIKKGYWDASSASMILNFYLGNENVWLSNASGTLIETGDTYKYYYVTVPNAYTTHTQVLRYNAGASEYWGGKTNTITAPTGSNNTIVNDATSVGEGQSVSWTIYAPPAKSVALSYNVVPSSGSGTELDPYIVPTGTTVRVTAAGTSELDDPDIIKKYKWDSGSYGTTAYKDLSCSTNNTTYSTTVSYKNYISSTASTNDKSATVYFKAVSTPTISLSAPSTGVRGNSITLTATPSNASTPTIVYEYSTSSTFASSVTSIASTTSTSQSWTIPSGTSCTTYYLRAKMTISATTYYSSILPLTAYGKKTIKVKNTNGWANLYIHAWDGSGDMTTWPGVQAEDSHGLSCTNVGGGLWWNVTITTQVNGFVLDCNGSGDSNQTADLSYSSYTNNNCYAIGTNDGKRTLSNTTVSCLTDAVVSTSEAGTIRETSATLGGNITSLGNDNVLEYGYYYSSSNSSLSGTNLTGATKVKVGDTKTSTGTYSKSQTGLTAGTTYYVIAYAKNGNGIVYGSRENFTTLSTYTVTVATENASKGTVSPTSVTAGQYLTSGTFTASPTTYYAFKEWTKSTNNITITSSTSASTTVKTTSTGTVTATFKDRWSIAGGNSTSADGSDDMGDWNTSANPLVYVSGTSVRCTITINTPGTYYLKVKDRREDSDHGWYGKNSTSISRASASASGLDTSGDNISLDADVAGTYVFTFDANSKNLTIKYPAKITWSASSIYSGSATIAASVTGVAASQSLKYELFNGTDMSVSAAQTYNATTTTTTDSHNFTVTPSFGESDINKVYTVKITYDGQYAYYTNVVGRKWDIYVHDVQGWGGVKLHKWGDYGGSTTYPGAACSKYNSTNSWYTVTIDGKCNTGFVLSKSGDDSKKTVDLTPSITTYPAGSYWYIHYTDSKYGLTSTSVSNPTVTLSIDKINVNQITVTGTVTSCGGDGTTAEDMKEVGFYLGETKYTASYTSGTTFKKTITSLTANTAYSVKAYAINVLGEGQSDATSVTTLANSNYRIKIQVPHGNTAPKVYAWTDGDSYGGSKMENGTYKSQDACSSLFTATTYDWYYCDLNNKYEKFLIYTTGDSDKSDDFTADREADCYYYNPSSSPKAGKLDCPRLTPHLAIKTSKAGADSYYEMSGDASSVSVGRSLTAGTYYIKVVYNTEYYGKGDDYANKIARTGSTSSNSVTGTAVNGGYIELTADFDGTYTFGFATSGKDISVTYPAAYRITYSATTVGGGTGNSAAPTASYNSGVTSVTSGTTWIPTGTTVAFSAKSANPGYTFKGWYSGTPNPADWSTNRIQEGAAYNRVVSASATIYAVYDENDYTVTVTKTTGGSIASTSVTGHKTTLADLPTATADPGYRFVNWTTTTGSLTNSSSATTGKINNLTSTATVTANFEPIWRIACSVDGYSTTSHQITNISTSAGVMTSGYVDITLAANTDYEFKVYQAGDANPYWGNEANPIPQITYSNQATAQSLTHNSGNNQTLHSAGAGSYRFTWDVTNSRITVGYPTSYTVTYDKKYRNIYDGVGSWRSGNTGGTIATTVGGNSLTSGNYVASGSSVVFTATPATGYSLYTTAGKKWSWYSTSDASKNLYIGGYNADTTTLSVTISKDTAAYVFFQENATKVKLVSELNGEETSLGGYIKYDTGSEWVASVSVNAGITTHPQIKAVPKEGYYFKEWQKKGSHITLRNSADNANVSGVEADSIMRLKSDGTASLEGDTLIAVFAPLEEIYFENSSYMEGGAWEDVYVYFGISWDGGKVKTNSNANYKVAMTGSYLKKAYVPREVTLAIGAATTYNIAFATQSVGTSAFLTSGKAASRGDYNKKLNLFVPEHTKKATTGGVDYFDNGFWWQEDGKGKQGAGYYLQTTRGTNVGEFVARADRSDYLEYTIRVDQSNTDKTFHIRSAGNVYYEPYDYTNSTYPKMTSDNYRKTMKAGDVDGFTVTLTSEGDYTFVLWKGSQYVWLEVEYPISEGDYRLKHTYNSGAKATYTDIIKQKYADRNTRYSMYLNEGGSPTLTLQKCTSTAGGVPVFSDVATDNSAALGASTGILKKVSDDGSGVYQFDMAINTTTDAVTVDADSTRLYTGSFYIKTDCATGMWANYKLNSMERNSINFSKSNSNTFDYYFCKWIDDARKKYSGCSLVNNDDGFKTNVRCVIANDYCNALSDTLKDDAITGSGLETLPIPGSVRFSYNSYTNEINRAYLNGASCWNDAFLLLTGDGKIKRADADAPFANNDTTFVDNNNWTYKLKLRAQPQARVRLTANYNGNVQYFVGCNPSGKTWDTSTEQILGGTGSDWNTLLLIYDFKTNHLMSAWLVDDDTETATDKAINTDVMIIRTEQGDAAQLTFSGKASLTDVDTVYSALRLTKPHVTNRTYNDYADSTLTKTERQHYWLSFPYKVKVSDIFGSVGVFGTDWILRYYDGKGRAEKGYWSDSNDNWKFLTINDTLNANEGYVLSLNMNNFYSWSSKWDNNVKELFLYFPSIGRVGNITEKDVDVTINQVGYECTIDRRTDKEKEDGVQNVYKDRRVADSYWHCIGIPSFANLTHAVDNTHWTDGDKDGNKPEAGDMPTIDWETETWSTRTLPYLYAWNKTTNDYTPYASSSFTFKAMHSYLVQYSQSTISWTAASAPSAVVARRAAGQDIEQEFRLEVRRGATDVDQAYVKLTENENVTANFDFNYDMTKMFNAGRTNVYTLVEGYLQAAGNCLPVSEQTTIVPVGIKTATAGDYTFSMPEGTNGIGVVLVDNATGVRTNLGLTDYTVTLEEGTLESRFVLEISPIAETPTDIEWINGVNGANGVRKVMIDGLLYIVKDGVIYDARGARVK